MCSLRLTFILTCLPAEPDKTGVWNLYYLNMSSRRFRSLSFEDFFFLAFAKHFPLNFWFDITEEVSLSWISSLVFVDVKSQPVCCCCCKVWREKVVCSAKNSQTSRLLTRRRNWKTLVLIPFRACLNGQWLQIQSCSYLSSLIRVLGRGPISSPLIPGKLFKSTALPNMVLFLLMFYSDKPWERLVEDFLNTQVCRFDQNVVRVW